MKRPYLNEDQRLLIRMNTSTGSYLMVNLKERRHERQLIKKATLKQIKTMIFDYLNRRKKLAKFRRNVNLGEKVLIDDGSRKFEATLVRKNEAYVTVVNADLSTGAYGIKCMYELKKS